MTRIANCALQVLDQSLTADDHAVTKASFDCFIDRGLKFEWVSVTQVKLTPAGMDGKAQCALWDGSNLKGFTITSDVTAAITSSGANGLDTGAEAASTFYCIWGIGKSDGTFALLLSVSATSPTMPSGYTFKRLLCGVSNDASSNFITFDHMRDGKVYYTNQEDNNVRGLAVLIAGNATAVTAVSLARAIPDVAGVTVGLHVRASNTNNTNSVFALSEDSGQTVNPFVSRNIGQTGTIINTEHWDGVVVRHTGDRTTSLYYKWATSTASIQAFVYVQYFSLGKGWGSGPQ